MRPADHGAGLHVRGVSIRLRLTLLYTAILALTLVAFSSILYLVQARATYGGVESSLVRQAEEFVRRDLDEGGARPPRDADLPSGTLPGRWTQTRTIDGTILGTTVDLRGATLPLSDAGQQAVQAGNGHSETAVVDEQPVMIYSRPFAARGGETRIVQVAFPIGQSQQSLRALQLLLASGSALAILLAFLLGWVFAGTALDPIHRITRTARSIGLEHDFSRRVAYDGRGDEVGQLAVTFNDMLAELESAFRQLEGSLDSQKRFVADASHELRTPLTTVRGNIELLRRNRPAVPPGERAEILADTVEEVDRLIRLVNQLLVLARAGAGQALATEDVAVAPLVEEVCRQVRGLAPECAVSCPPAPDVTVHTHRDALKQVLLILLDNAARHTPAGSAVDVRSESAAGRLSISVSDDGPGIPAVDLPHIFERFYRGDAARTGEGAGLGLAIAKELIELQGGALTVASEPGQGSTFTVSLPLAG